MNTPRSRGPLVVGVGIDLADVARLAAAIRRRSGLASRLFTADELHAIGLAGRGAAGGEPDGVEWRSVAQRFAAKEAVMKALGVGIDSVAFTDIELSGDLGAVRLLGRARIRAAEIGAQHWSVGVGLEEGPGGPVATAEVIASSTLG